jgi:DNA-binding CsgD family transcriptional regulator/predicted negative regulator of RcsB-dependent stress response
VVGQHLLHVPPGGEPDNVDILLEASVLARNAGEPARALAFAERASAEPPAPDQRRRVLAEVARSAASADDERWHRLATAAIEHSPEHAPRLLESIGRDLMALSRIDEAAAAHAWGLRIVEDDPKEHLRLLARFVHAIRVRVDRPGDHLDLVDELAAAVDAYPLRDTPEWRQAAALLAYQRAITVSTAAAVDVLARAALDPAYTTDREILEGVPYFGAVQAASIVGSDAELIAVERALEVGEKREAMHVIEVALAYRGSRRLREGFIDEAVSDLERARKLGPMVLLTVPKVMTELAQSLLEQGRVDAAQDALDSVDREVYRATGFYNGYLRTRGLVRAAHGDLEAALADLMHCGEREEKVLVEGAIAIPWAFDAAIVLVDLGRRPEATALLERPLAAARNQGVPFRIAHGLRALAATQAADSAVLTLRASLAVLDGTPWDLERLNAELALGRVLVASGERAEALALLRGVVDRAHRQGAGRVAQLGLASLREAGTRPRRLALMGEAALTPTEREIVRLASEGRTNAEIAKGREVSVKAVEHHLTSAFRKLGVRSRHELAR